MIEQAIKEIMFLANGNISLVLVNTGAIPKTPNNITHRGDINNSHFHSIKILSVRGTADNPAISPPKIEVIRVHIHSSLGRPGTKSQPPLSKQIFTELIESIIEPSSP